MAIVREDEHGPWIDFGEQSYYGAALRPVSPTRLKAGDEVDYYHFGGSTLHGVGKVEGTRGAYKECWISAPAEKSVYESRCEDRKKDVGYDYSLAHYAKDVALFHRGNPDFEPQSELQRIPRLKAGRAKYMASAGYTMGLMAIPELGSEGAAHLGAIKAHWEARKLSEETPQAEGLPKPKLRM